jgi:peptidoglycan DL-endopeptidase CwlO
MTRFFATALSLFALAAVGCAPRAGQVRPQHPLLGAEVGARSVTAAAPFAPVLDDSRPSDDADAVAARARIASVAAGVVGGGPVVVGGERFRMDCSGVARGIYAKAGLRLGYVEVTDQTNDTRVLYELVRRTGSLRRHDPLPGDLVFFDDTYDQNGNGLTDDPLSHVGVVERVEPEGTVVFVHRVGKRIVRARLDLSRPHDRHDEDGRALNHYLRSARGSTPAKTTGELFVAFGSLPVSKPALLAQN